MSGNLLIAVAAGLASGIIFIILFSVFFAQEFGSFIPVGDYHPKPGRIADKAINIAMEDATIQQLFRGRDIVITSVRDWGVASIDCEFNWCAVILFDDKLDNVTGFVAVDVNVKSAKVAGVSFVKDILIEKANQTKEAKYFLLKYPDAKIDVKRDRMQSSVTYTVTRQVGDPGDAQERTRLLAVIFDKSLILQSVPSVIRLYCLNNLSTPAIGGDILGRIDNDGCFGKTS